MIKTENLKIWLNMKIILMDILLISNQKYVILDIGASLLWLEPVSNKYKRELEFNSWTDLI